jgi:hypothetical protein
MAHPNCERCGPVAADGFYPCRLTLADIAAPSESSRAACLREISRELGQANDEAEVPRLKLDCVHLGEQTERLVLCVTCKGKTALILYSCACYGECTIQRRLKEVAGCNAGLGGPMCPDYLSRGVEVKNDVHSLP